MTPYAIKVVPNDWKDTMPLPFHKTTHAYNRIEAGMHVLIYRRAVGIVGDAEVRNPFVRTEDWVPESSEPLPPSLIKADYLLPLEAVYYRGRVVSPDTVRQILSDPSFPMVDSWRPIDAQIYQQLLRRLL